MCSPDKQVNGHGWRTAEVVVGIYLPFLREM